MAKRLSKIDEQIIFYCKGWFLHTDITEDIKIIMSHIYAIDSQYYNEKDVLIRLFKTAFNCAPPEDIQSRIMNIFGKMDVVSTKDMINNICGLLCSLERDDILVELNEPDYTLLPKAKFNYGGVADGL